MRDLQERLRLAVAARSAHGEGEPAVGPQGHHRGQRVVGALARSHLLGMAVLERVERAAVVEEDPGLGLQQARAEAREVALDPAHRVAPPVDRRQVDRVARVVHVLVLLGRQDLVAEPGLDRLGRPPVVDHRGPRPQIVRVEEALDRDLDVLGVGDPAVAVRERELLELDQRVQVLGRVVALRRDRMRLGHLHERELRDALGVRGEHQERVVEVAAP